MEDRTASDSKRRPGRPTGNDPLAARDTREVILHAAATLFMRDGYGRVSLHRVARHAGLTKATLYYYFHSKNDLFTEAVTQLVAKRLQEIKSLLSDRRPHRERLLAFARQRLQERAAERDLQSVLFEAAPALGDEAVEQLSELNDQVLFVLSDLLNDAVQQRVLRAEQPHFLALSFLGQLRTVALGGAKHLQSLTDEQQADSLVRLFWEGARI